MSDGDEEGFVAAGLKMSDLVGDRVGGTVQILVYNKEGFTWSTEQAKS